MELRISRSGRPGDAPLTVVGVIDLATRETLLQAGREVLEAGESISLDMSGVDFLDSCGIGALVQLAKESVTLGHTFTITEMSPAVQRVLRMTGLDRLWSGD